MWYSVRHVIQNSPAFEERITLWQADNADQAIQLALAEAAEYAKSLFDGKVLAFAQVYELCESAQDGREVFSLIRESDLPPDDYLNAYFDTGRERQT